MKYVAGMYSEDFIYQFVCKEQLNACKGSYCMFSDYSVDSSLDQSKLGVQPSSKNANPFHARLVCSIDLYTSSTLNSCIVDLNYATLSGNNKQNCKTPQTTYVVN